MSSYVINIIIYHHMGHDLGVTAPVTVNNKLCVHLQITEPRDQPTPSISQQTNNPPAYLFPHRGRPPVPPPSSSR